MIQTLRSAYEGDEEYIFVSYSHENRNAVYGEIAWLQEQGLNVFYDEGITPGSEWSEALAERISGCTWLLFFITPQSVASEHCRRELGFAIEEDRLILAVHLEETQVPAGIRLSLNNRQAILRWRLDNSVYRHRLARVLDAPTADSGDESVLASAGARNRWSRPRVRRVVAVSLAAIIAVALAIHWIQARRTEREELIALTGEIEALIEEGLVLDAWSVAQARLDALRKEPGFNAIWSSIAQTLSVETDPPGASAAWRRYDEEGTWNDVGQTPLVGVEVPKSPLVWRFEKPGHRPVYRVDSLPTYLGRLPQDDANVVRTSLFQETVTLELEDAIPEGMVRVPATHHEIGFSRLSSAGQVELPAFYIDRHEVTNREFQEFVDKGGYSDLTWWEGQEFVVEGEELEPSAALTRFVDRTGRLGPSTWELGKFPPGQGDYPVAGVSWHEAVAYARFRDRQLPTVWHWARAAMSPNEVIAPLFPTIGPYSRLASNSPVEVGYALNAFGTYDAVGNVREWCLNTLGQGKAALGGGWSDPAYLSTDFNSFDPMDRSELNGFRTAIYPTAPAAALLSEIDLPFREPAKLQAVSDEAFQPMLEHYRYQSDDPQAEVMDRRESEDWVLEVVEIDAGHNDERLPVYLYLPKTFEAPHQAVIWFPGHGPFRAQATNDSHAEFDLQYLDFLPRTGRALIVPIWWNSYERHTKRVRTDVEPVTKWRTELGRLLDYISERGDVEGTVFAGLSYGSSYVGPVLLAVENRIDVAVMMSSGIPEHPARSPLVDPLNFVPRVTVPLRHISGRYDGRNQLQLRQFPTFARWGTPEGRKKHVIYDSGHWPFPRSQLVREVTDWLDRFLGPA